MYVYNNKKNWYLYLIWYEKSKNYHANLQRFYILRTKIFFYKKSRWIFHYSIGNWFLFNFQANKENYSKYYILKKNQLILGILRFCLSDKYIRIKLLEFLEETINMYIRQGMRTKKKEETLQHKEQE